MSHRFLVTCWPLTGHLHGQLAIAATMRERGHDVAFYTGASQRAAVDSEQLPFFPFDAVDEGAVLELIHAVESRDARARPDPRLVKRTLRRWLVDTIPNQIVDIERIIEEWQPDVIITDLSMWGPIVVLGEKHQLPVALSSTFMGPLIPGPGAPPWGLGLPAPRNSVQQFGAHVVNRATEVLGTGLRRRLDEIRRSHGLGPLGCSVNEHTRSLPLYLVGNVKELDYGRTDLPSSVRYVGPTMWYPPSSEDVTRFLNAIPHDRPWVHITEGTLHRGAPFILEAAIEGLGDGPYEVILTTGFGRRPEDLGLSDLPPNVHVLPWINHPELLARCDAVVTSGGAGTIIAAVAAGVPLVVVPTTWDKPDNARRVTTAGVGLTLAPKKCTPESLRACVETVLSDSRYRTAARQVAKLLAEAPGLPGAANLLERLALTATVEARP